MNTETQSNETQTEALNKHDVSNSGTTAHFYNMAFDRAKKQKFLDSGHDWETDEDGCIDTFAMESGNHNGPRCKKCGYDTCWHCNENPPKCHCC